jgi:hypothetical protein
VAGALRLGVGEVVDQLHLLHQVTANACRQEKPAWTSVWEPSRREEKIARAA